MLHVGIGVLIVGGLLLAGAVILLLDLRKSSRMKRQLKGGGSVDSTDVITSADAAGLSAAKQDIGEATSYKPYGGVPPIIGGGGR